MWGPRCSNRACLFFWGALRYLGGAACWGVLVWAGCATSDGARPGSVLDKWQASRQPAPTQPDPAPLAATVSSTPHSTGPAIATVNGQPIERRRLQALLLAGRGAELLDELIVLELARSAAQAQGLTVSKRDVEREHRESLRSLVGNLPAADGEAFDSQSAEALLDQVLAGRGMSRKEYRLGMLRNAYLRKLAAGRLEITDEQVRADYARRYGDRVQIRHIQMAAGPELEEVRRQLGAGVSFADLARRYSANTVTAAAGGLLEPFSRDDQDIPALLREAAWALEVGQVSNPIRVDNWHHIIKLEKRLPAESVPFEQVGQEVRARLRQRMMPLEMQRLSAELFEKARIEIADPGLRADYVKRHGQSFRSDKQ
ncbi:MAG: peptidylprolyl isomerase [Phycisphaerae bacterium]